MQEQSFKILIILTLVSSTLFSIINPMARELTAALNLESEERVIFVNSIFLMVAAFSSLAWAFLGDRFSRKKLLLAATFSWTLFTFLTLFSTDFYSFLTFQACTAVGFGAIIPLVFSLTIDLIPPAERGMKFGYLSAIYVLGNGLGQILSGTLIDYYTWHAPLLIISISGVFCLLSLFFLEDPKREEIKELDKKAENSDDYYLYHVKLNDLKKIWQKKSIFWILLFNFCMFIGIGAISSFLISMFKKDFTLPSSIATSLLIVVFGTQVPSGLIFGKIGDKKYEMKKRGRINVAFTCLLMGSLSYIAGFSIVLISKQALYFSFFLAFLIMGAFFFGGIDPLIQATLGESTPPPIRSTVYSINYLTTTTLGRSLSLLVLGRCYLFFNYHYVPGYLLLSLIAFCCALFYLPILKNLINDLQWNNNIKSEN